MTHNEQILTVKVLVQKTSRKGSYFFHLSTMMNKRKSHNDCASIMECWFKDHQGQEKATRLPILFVLYLHKENVFLLLLKPTVLSECYVKRFLRRFEACALVSYGMTVIQERKR